MTRKSNIRLSEAIMAGSVLIHFNPNFWYNAIPSRCGCLIGMGMVAAGYEDELMAGGLQDPTIIAAYPWLIELMTPPPLPHCPSARRAYSYLWVVERSQAIHIISYMAHCVKHGLMTLEQAVDWIRSVEPAPDCEFLDDEPILSDVEALASR